MIESTESLSLDIGFDRRALPKTDHVSSDGSSHPCAQLRCGLTVPDLVGNPIHLAQKVTAPCGLLLTLYDLTTPDVREPGKIAPEVDYLSLRLGFEKAQVQHRETPAAYSNALDEPVALYQRFSIHRTETGWGHSTVFERGTPAWRALVPTIESPKFPRNQLASGPGPAHSCLEIRWSGSYYFTLDLQVGVVGLEKPYRFRVDPEMVVENVGPVEADEGEGEANTGGGADRGSGESDSESS